MRRFAALTAILIALIIGPSIYADHNNPPVLPLVLDKSTPALQALFQNGELRVGLDAQMRSNPTIVSQLQNVINAYTAALNYPVFRYVDPSREDVDILISVPPDATFIGACGAGAAGCVYYADARPVPIYVRLSLGYSDWRSVFAHELGHVLGEHEMYDDRNFACYPAGTQFPTQMQCGRPEFGRSPQFPFDVYTIWNVTVPDIAACNTSSYDAAYFYVFACDRRADGGLAHFGRTDLHSNTTRVAVFISDDDGASWWWAGPWYLPKFDKNGWTSRGFARAAWCPPDAPGRLFGLRPENAATYAIPYISGQIAVAGKCPAPDATAVATPTLPPVENDTDVPEQPRSRHRSFDWNGFAIFTGTALGAAALWIFQHRRGKP